MAKRPVPLYDFKAFGGSHKSREKRIRREPEKGKRRVIYFPALPCEYREQGATAEFTGVL